MTSIRKINHVAIAVENIENALAFWRDALGLTLTHIEDVPGQNTLVAFLPTGDSEIELVKPTTTDSGLARFIEKRGPGVHHVCLEVDNLEATLNRLKGLGVELINETPAIGAGGARMAFIHPRSAFGVLVELYETRRQSEVVFPRISTPRLELRPFETRDTQQIYEIFSQEAVTRSIPSPTLTSLDEAAEKLNHRKSMFDQGIGIRWGLALKPSDILIGSCGFYFPDKLTPTVEIGFELHPHYWRQGYMIEALSAIISLTFSENCPVFVHRIEGLTKPDNQAAIALFNKLGFQEEGILREHGYWKNQHHDLKLFALLRHEWHSRST